MTDPLEAALTTALLELTRRHVPPDVQELLVHGDPGRVAPGALSAAVARALLAREQAVADACRRGHMRGRAAELMGRRSSHGPGVEGRQ